ncbi:type VI secretion protein [Streptomyces sp. NPDC047108]|uniref:type VI secretion protein n=1 Tax=Streptomyces sp. NPDC047108 TaxID=3155025 RepID=UPI0033E0713B
MTASGGQGRGGPGGPGSERGIPDGLLVGVLAFLLGLTVLVWTATGISGLFAHGSWPDGVHFTRTPAAMRHLTAEPHNIAAAWPETPADQFSGYGLFWGIFLGELMVLTVLAVFVIGTVARWRAVRRGGAMGRKVTATATAVRQDDVAYETQRTAEAVPAARTEPAPTATVPATRPEPAPTATAAEPVRSAAPAVPPAPETSAPAGAGPPERATDPAAARGTVEPALDLTKIPATAPGTADGAAAAPRDQQALTGLHFTGPRPESRRELALRAIRSADGPVLVTTSDPAVWARTKDARAKLGPVHLYDPSHLLDTPARLRWSPSAGCESRDTAAARAAALLAPVRPLNSLDSAMADAAETLLRCWLHAAAVDGRAFRQVHRWASGSAAQDAVRILRTHPQAASGAAGELESTLTAYPERREAAQQLTARALSALSSIHIRDACNPTRADSLAVDSFVAEGGTLYVVGEAIEDPRTHPGAMPLLTALVSSVVEHGRRMAVRSSAGRLDPPLTLVLDDVAAVAPLPQLPDLLAEGEAQGMTPLALLRSEEQARARWPRRTLVAEG